jgi:hypothetical protein
MITGNVDADNGYNISASETVKFALIPSTVFVNIANDIYYGLGSTNEILTSYIKANIGEDGAIKILKSNTDSVVLDEDFDEVFGEHDNLVFYLVAYYSNNEDFNNSSYIYYSSNFVKISYTAEKVLEENEIKFFSNKINFTYSSISTQLNAGVGGGNGTFKLSITTDNMNYKSYDYKKTQFNNDKISLMNLSITEFNYLIDIFTKSNSDEYYEIELNDATIYLKDFTIEQTLELILYVISSKDAFNKDIFVKELLRNTINDASTNNKETLLGSTFEKLLTEKGGVTINVSPDNSFDITNDSGVKGYIIGFVLNEDKSFKVVTQNLVYYEVSGYNTLPYSIVTISEKIAESQV